MADQDVELFPYQVEGVKWLYQKKRALLADPPGLGKTAQAIRALNRAGIQKVLVVCPAIARFNWQNELTKFSTVRLNSHIILSSAETPPDAPILITSYDLLTKRSLLSTLTSRKYEAVIFDESHYLANRNAQRTQAAFNGLLPQSEAVWALSGTPARNHAGDLYPLLNAFGLWNRGYWPFMDRFTSYRETPYGIQVTGGKRIEELRALIAPVCLRRRKEDTLKDLPPLLFTDVVLEPGPVDIPKYFHDVNFGWISEERLKADVEAEIKSLESIMDLTGASESAIDALTGLQNTRNKNILSRRYIGLQKCAPVAEILLDELESHAYPKIVLFCWHRDVINELRERLHKFGAESLYGGTPAIKRERILQKFKQRAHTRVLIAQIQAGGIAINLTHTNEVGFVEQSYVPADNVQAVLRVHRLGQPNPVRVRYFSLAGHVDEAVNRILKRKTKWLIEMFDKGASTPFTNPFE